MTSRIVIGSCAQGIALFGAWASEYFHCDAWWILSIAASAIVGWSLGYCHEVRR